MAAPASKPPTGNRKSFVRTRVPAAEQIAGWVIVVLLTGIGASILVKGRRYDPGRFMLRTEALSSTTASVEGKSSTAPGGSDGRPVKTTTAQSVSGTDALREGYGDEDTAAAHTAGTPAQKQEPLDLKVDGVAPMGPTEFYAPDNLFEKIDGRAPAYLGFNFQQLRCRSFSVAGEKGSFVDVFEFRFDTPVNAFGMFALERDPKGGPLNFVPDGYGGELGFYFRQGVCYVQIIASDQKAGTLAGARTIAENRAKVLPADDAGLAARRRLPTQGLDPASVAFVAENAMGQASLKNVFQARYDFGGKKLPFFLMVASPAETAAAWRSYQDFAAKIGGKVTVLPDVNGAKLFQAETFGSWSVIYQREGEIGGVYEADDGAKARQFVEQQLQGSAP